MRGPVVVLTLCLLAVGCERSRLVEYEMTWSDLTEPDHIVLDFVDFPNHYIDIVSADLRTYLDTLPDERVTVQLEVTTRLGCLERIRTVRIGERDDWPKVWGGSGWVGQEDPSPWDEYRCRIPWR